MIKLIIKRLLVAIPTLIVIIAFVFILMRLAPGGPLEKNIQAAYNLDKSIPEQFLIYVSNIIKGDFGPSFKYKDFTVNELILSGFPVSLTLGLSSIIVALFLGVFLGF